MALPHGVVGRSAMGEGLDGEGGGSGIHYSLKI